MEINQAAVEAKKQEYLARKQSVSEQLNNNQATLFALDGAIQDCDYWLSQFTSVEASAQETQPPPAETPSQPS